MRRRSATLLHAERGAQKEKTRAEGVARVEVPICRRMGQGEVSRPMRKRASVAIRNPDRNRLEGRDAEAQEGFAAGRRSEQVTARLGQKLLADVLGLAVHFS